MRPLAVACVACLLAGCGSDRGPRDRPRAASPAPPGAAPARQASIDPTVQFLLAASAKDFHAHRRPARLRDVRSGLLPGPDGTRSPLLRGEFQPEGGDWTPFVTIKTSDYEQWLGPSAEAYSRQPSIAWDDREDLSAALQGRLDALR